MYKSLLAMAVNTCTTESGSRQNPEKEEAANKDRESKKCCGLLEAQPGKQWI